MDIALTLLFIMLLVIHRSIKNNDNYPFLSESAMENWNTLGEVTVWMILVVCCTQLLFAILTYYYKV